MSAGVDMLGQCTLLLIDDDPDIRHSVKDLLEYEGFAVTTASRGVEAIQHVLHHSFSAAVLDIGLPDFDGRTILKVLLELDAHLPVIVLTGHITIENTVGTLEKGAFAYLTKPYNRDELKATVRRAVALRKLISQAAQAQDDLEESLERFRAIVESAHDAIVLANAEGRIVSWNQAAQLLFGFTNAEARGREFSSLMPTRYTADAVNAMDVDGTKASGAPYTVQKPLEVMGLRKDGHEIPLEVTITTWKAKSETYWGAIFRDISERKQAEVRLKESEERYRLLYEANPSMYFTVNVEGFIESVNQFGAEQLGYDTRELIGRSVLSIVHEDDRHQASRQLRSLFEHPTGLTHWDFRKVCKDGTVVWVKEAVRVISVPDGTSKALIVCEDITDQKRAEEKLLRQERELRDFFDNGILGHHWVGPDGHILRANQAELSMLGYASCEYVGHHISEFHVDRAAMEEFLRRLSRGESVQNFEIRLRCKDGSIKTILLDSNVLWENGRFIHTRCFTRDITAQKRADERLSRINDCFLRFGANAEDNISRLVEICGVLMEADWASYHRMNGTTLQLHSHWHLPPNFPSRDATEGGMCFDVVHNPDNGFLAIQDLQQTHYAKTDPLVATFQLETYVGRPVRCSDKPIGCLSIVYRKQFRPRPADAKVIELIAAAIGIEEDRKRAEESNRMSERRLRLLIEERERLSRDLHDGIIQSIYAVGLGLEDCRKDATCLSPECAANLKDATENLNAVIRDIRLCIMALQEPLVIGAGLHAVMDSLIKRLCGNRCDAVRFDFDPDVERMVTAEEAMHIVFVMREALSNSLRHARPDHIVISLSNRRGKVQLKIEDDGCGFDSETVKNGLGLDNMRARAQELNARLKIDSGSRGTRVVLDISK